MLNTVDPRQFDRPFQEVLRDSIQANANQVARRCRVMIENERHSKNPRFMVALVKLLVQEIEADINHYSVEISMYPMYAWFSPPFFFFFGKLHSTFSSLFFFDAV